MSCEPTLLEENGHIYSIILSVIYTIASIILFTSTKDSNATDDYKLFSYVYIGIMVIIILITIIMNIMARVESDDKIKKKYQSYVANISFIPLYLVSFTTFIYCLNNYDKIWFVKNK